MNIVLGKESIEHLDSRYTVLELDTFWVPSIERSIVSYCIVENLPILEMSQVDTYKDLHQNLIKNYRLKNWSYCEDAIEHLMFKWNGELKTFYEELYHRIQALKEQNLDSTWDGSITKSI